MMRIAVPIQDGKLNQHFGHSRQFAFVDADPATRRVAGSTVAEAPPHQPGFLPPWLKNQGVSHVIAGGMGAHAQALCRRIEIEVITGAPEESPEALALRFLEGTLVTQPHACDHDHSHHR